MLLFGALLVTLSICTISDSLFQNSFSPPSHTCIPCISTSLHSAHCYFFTFPSSQCSSSVYVCCHFKCPPLAFCKTFFFCNTFPCLHISQFVHNINTFLHFLDINICRMVFYAYFTICVSATFDNEIGHQVHAELLSLLQLFTLLLLSFLVNFSC